MFNHRHGAEIEQGLGREVTFTPHLRAARPRHPETIYVRVAPGTTEEALGDVLRARPTRARPFVRLTGSALPEIKHVAHTNFCDIGWRVDPSGRAILVSVIDNLLKGASGQAVQNMNVMLGLDERTRPAVTRVEPATLVALLKFGGELLEDPRGWPSRRARLIAAIDGAAARRSSSSTAAARRSTRR